MEGRVTGPADWKTLRLWPQEAQSLVLLACPLPSGLACTGHPEPWGGGAGKVSGLPESQLPAGPGARRLAICAVALLFPGSVAGGPQDRA